MSRPPYVSLDLTSQSPSLLSFWGIEHTSYSRALQGKMAVIGWGGGHTQRRATRDKQPHHTTTWSVQQAHIHNMTNENGVGHRGWVGIW